MGHVYFYNHTNAHQKPIWEPVYKPWRAPVISIFLRLRDRGLGVHQTGEELYVMQGIHGTHPPLWYPNFTQLLWLIWNVTNPLKYTKPQFSWCYWYSQDMSWWLYRQGVFVTVGCKSILMESEHDPYQKLLLSIMWRAPRSYFCFPFLYPLLGYADNYFPHLW